ncbi:MAG: hypothetical protein OXC44_06190 [Proteobacteria bacterium]|nr:hypothetical protein [Pseudomonadota bacterium]
MTVEAPLQVLAAQAFEAKPTLDMLSDVALSYRFYELGIGPLVAGRSVAQLPPSSKVIYIGSCGEFACHHVLELVTCETLYWSPPSIRTNMAALVEPAPPLSLPCVSRNAVASQLSSVMCFTSPAITLCADLVPSQLSTASRGVENLELYAVGDYLARCQDVTIVLGITNVVGKDGRRQWRENYGKAAMITAEFLYEQRHLLL